MSALDDIIITLEDDQNFFSDSRTIDVDLSSAIDFDSFTLDESFGFTTEAVNSVDVDPLARKGLVISLKKSVVLSSPDIEIAVTYSARSFTGEEVTGRITFPDVEFEIAVTPITFELDSCCSLPDIIIINVRDYNGSIPVVLTSIGSNKYGAATVTLSGNDYNNDFNGDFNFGSTSDPHKLITYRLNKNTDFWKTLNAEDEFQYNISYQGKTASNFIRVKLKK